MRSVATNCRRGRPQVATIASAWQVRVVSETTLERPKLAGWEGELQATLADPRPGPAFSGADEFLSWRNDQ